MERSMSLLALTIPAVVLSAQTLKYDVISVKPNKTGGESYVRPVLRGTLTARNVSLFDLIQWAYALPAWRILGNESWMANDKFDIDAKEPTAPGPLSFEQVLQMQQA